MTMQIKEARKILSLGFVGVGWIGKNRMEAIVKSGIGRASLIYDSSADSAAAASEVSPEAKLALDSSEVLDNSLLDGVVIATPSALHAEQALQALNNNLAVFCQKPLGRNAAEVQELIEASEKADRLLAVDLSYRYTEAFQAIHSLITSGDIGKVYAVDLVFHNAYGPDKSWFYDIKQSGGGCVMDLGTHLIDLAMWTLDFPETEVVNRSLYSKGKLLQKHEEQVEDFASVNLLTSCGTSISLQCSWNVSAGCDAVIEAKFYGTNGGAAFKNLNGSFYDFTAEKYNGTNSQTLVSPPDEWSGRAGVVWAERVAEGCGFDRKSAIEFLKTAQIIDSIYGR